MAKLVFHGGPGPEVEYPVGPTHTSIGRTPDQDVYLAHDSVSRLHARIDRIGDRFQISDLRSTNGTFVKGARVRQALLEEGDAVVIGELRFRFSYEEVSGQGETSGILRGVGRMLELLSEQSGGSGSQPAVPILGDMQEAPERPGSSPGGAAASMERFLDGIRDRSSKWENAYRQLTVLYRIAYLLQDSDSVEVKLDKVVKLAIGTLKAERGFLFQYEPATDELVSSIAYSKSSDGGSHLDWVRAVSRRAIDSDEPMASGPNISVGSAMTRPPSGRVFIAAPLRTPRGIHGSLYLDARSGQASWGKEEVEFVRTLAAQIGATYDHEHYSRQMIQKSEIERELSIARRIQQGLLPELLETGAGVRAHGRSIPSKEVGGDYYDTFRAKNGQTYWLMADVSGKGVPAALVQAQVRAQLRAMGRNGVAPEVILTDLNESLLNDFDGRMYVTCAMGVVDPERGKLRYVNAGHEYPQLLRADTGELVSMEAGDHPCGLFRGVAFQSHEVEFRRGDTLLLATDGIVDSQNTQEERFGPERFRKLLRSCLGLPGIEIVETIFRTVHDWGVGAPQRDDATLLAVEFFQDP